MKKSKNIYVLTLSIALLAAPWALAGTWLNPTLGKGAWTREKIATAHSPTAIHVSGPVEVSLVSGPKFEAYVEADENLIGKISKKVSDSALDIAVPTSVRPSKKVQITVTLPQLDEAAFNGAYTVKLENFHSAKPLKITLNGSGLAEFENLHVASLKVIASGSGLIRASGETPALDLELTGALTLMADDLKTPRATLQAEGSPQILLGSAAQISGHLAGNVSLHLSQGTDTTGVQASMNRTPVRN